VTGGSPLVVSATTAKVKLQAMLGSQTRMAMMTMMALIMAMMMITMTTTTMTTRAEQEFAVG
jgi:hypothetical protein